jgi:hypothetical protein
LILATINRKGLHCLRLGAIGVEFAGCDLPRLLTGAMLRRPMSVPATENRGVGLFFGGQVFEATLYIFEISAEVLIKF